MPTADLNDNKLISEEISIIKGELAKLQNKKEIKHEEISDSEYEYRTDNGTDDEKDEEPTKATDENEIIETKEEKPNENEDNESENNESGDEDDYLNEIKELINEETTKPSLEKKIKKNKSIDLTKYVKREVKQYLNAFDVNIKRIIKKYKNVNDITEDELLKIQSKYNTENTYFNKKSKKLLNKLNDYDDLHADEYKLLNKKIKKIRNTFTDFISEFVDNDNDNSESDSD
tara:strand:+ start:564 stop:1256 length:693 start_codon:yes stop_codon:yes gene_type:complete